jgi:uncharacterized RDD family membrane protein YckC
LTPIRRGARQALSRQDRLNSQNREESPVSIENPYAAPQARLTDTHDVAGDSELASRSTRLGAAIVDGVIGIAIAFPLMYVSGVWNYVVRGENPPLGLTLAMGALGFLGFLLIHGYLLMTNGQTVGKKLAGIRIADLNGAVPGFATLILRRYLPISLVAQIPVAGPYVPLLDDLFIFRADRRCLHDLIAGTKVVTTRRRGNQVQGITEPPVQSTDWMFKSGPRLSEPPEPRE